MKKTNRLILDDSTLPEISNATSSPLSGKSMTSLKTRLIITFMILLTTAVFSLDGRSAEGTSSEQRSVADFNAIEIQGAFKVVLVQGSTESVTVDAETDALPKIITKVEGNTLKISTKNLNNHKGEITLTINFKTIKSVECAGSIHLSSPGPLKFDDFSFESSGASKTNLELTAAKLNIDISGAGNATLKGSASDVELDISGSGKYMASELTSLNYDIDISGSGNAEIAVSKNLEINISGSGALKYKGDPKIKQDISGVGKIEKI